MTSDAERRISVLDRIVNYAKRYLVKDMGVVVIVYTDNGMSIRYTDRVRAKYALDTAVENFPAENKH